MDESDIPIFTLISDVVPGSTIEFTDEYKNWEFGHEYSYYARVWDENDEQGFGKKCYLYLGIQPAKPTFSVAIGENGQLPVTLTVAPPTETEDGDPLTVPLTELRLVQYIQGLGEVPLTSITNPTQGEFYTWIHEDAQLNNKYSYRAYAICDYGKSEYAWADVYVGFDKPAAPTDLEMIENDEGGIILSWKAPEKGVNGGTLDPTSVKYKVSRLGEEPKELAEDLTECTFKDTLDDLTGPTNVKYEILAYNSIGEGGTLSSSEILTGPAYQREFGISISTLIANIPTQRIGRP